MLILCISLPVSAQDLSNPIDDYTNNKSGVESGTYTFTLDGNGKNAVKNGSSEMT